MTPFNPTTNSELTSGLPITQDIMRRLRDDGYTKLPDSGQTNETDTSKSLAPDGAGGVVWKIAPTAAQNVLLITTSGSVSIPIGTRIKLTVVGGGGTAGTPGSGGGVNTSATDGTTTVVAAFGGCAGSSNGTGGGGGVGFTIPVVGGTAYNGGPSPAYGYGRGLSSATAGGNSGEARVISMVMASGMLTVVIGQGTGGSGGGTLGAVAVEY